MSEKVDIEREVLDALDFEIICQTRMVTYMIRGDERVKVNESDPCRKPAVAMLRCRGCGGGFYVCATHLRFAQETRYLFCLYCNRDGSPTAVYQIIPLPVPRGGAE